ncbi:MAG: BrnA antitoxin family protein [Pyrinomonadaceae bacterium]|nr:BrnA antitoxin family protein [Pyrinomonadaceae bacterium]
MTENNQKQLPKFDSLDELTNFFDENDMGDYLENMPEADFEVNIKRQTYFVAVDEELADKISEISRREQLPSETIVNSWLREKISSYSEKI